MKKLLLAVSLVTLIGLPAFAGPIVINNPSFEVPTGTGIFDTVPALNTTSIPGWTVQAGSVDHITNYWPAADGIRSIDMNGLSPGTLLQQIMIPQAGTMTLDFAMAGNPDGEPVVKTLEVSLLGDGAPQVFTFDVSGASLTNMHWVNQTANFVVPSAGNYTLQFRSLSDGPYGAALDNVRASIPDGGATAMLLGLGLLAVAGLRRKLHV